jgi:hypothetical protein
MLRSLPNVTQSARKNGVEFSPTDALYAIISGEEPFPFLFPGYYSIQSVGR